MSLPDHLRFGPDDLVVAFLFHVSVSSIRMLLGKASDHKKKAPSSRNNMT